MFSRFLDYLSPWRGDLVAATTFSILNKVFDVAPEILIGVAVDVVVQREESFLAGLGVPELEHQLALLGGLTVGIWAAESTFQYLQKLWWQTLAQSVQNRVRAQVFDHVQNLEMGAIDTKRQGEIQTILTEDVNQLERFLNTGLNDIVQVITSTLLVSAVFLVIAPKIALFTMLPIPVILLMATYFQRNLGLRYAEVRNSAGRLGASLTSLLHGISTLKSYTAQGAALALLENDSQNYESTNKRAIRLSSAFVPLIRMAVLTGFVVTLVYGGLETLSGALAVGAYSVLIFLTQRLLWPFTRLGETVDLYQRSMASAGRLLGILELPREPVAESLEQDAGINRGAIAFQDVTFAYPERPPALRNVTLAVEENSFVGIVGSTGSGKSTLVKLLLRFYAPSSGLITIGDRDVSTLSLTALRQHIGWVSQEAFLFHGTIADNIRMGNPEATPASVEEAAKVAELHDFIESLPAGYDTPLADFGASLSGGQRQRLSIARAILKDPAVLVLDEATSAVDNETEAAIQRSMEKIRAGRTLIVIAHRLSTVRDADRIVVLEDGAITEDGTHAQLVASGERYANLWAIQVGEHPQPSAHD